MTRLTPALAAAVLFAFAAPAHAQGPGEALRMLQDRQGIEAVLFQYAVGLDTLNADLYVGAFTEDAEFVQGDTTRRGAADIRKVITDLIKSREERKAAGQATPEGMHHVVTNSVIELVDEDEARHRSYWMTVIDRGERKYEIAGMGAYEDYLVKRGGRWLFKRREIKR